MTDELDIPAFLDLSDPENLRRHKEARKTWKPSTIRAAEKAKINRDAQGRALPKNMDETSWAILRALEKDNAKAERDEKAERFRILAADKAEKKRIRDEARKHKTG